MKYSVKIIFGKEQVNKFYNSESFTVKEKQSNIKEYFFNTEEEKKAFCSGINEAVGWIECCIVENELCL